MFIKKLYFSYFQYNYLVVLLRFNILKMNITSVIELLQKQNHTTKIFFDQYWLNTCAFSSVLVEYFIKFIRSHLKNTTH